MANSWVIDFSKNTDLYLHSLKKDELYSCFLFAAMNNIKIDEVIPYKTMCHSCGFYFEKIDASNTIFKCNHCYTTRQKACVHGKDCVLCRKRVLQSFEMAQEIARLKVELFHLKAAMEKQQLLSDAQILHREAEIERLHDILNTRYEFDIEMGPMFL
jgi:hypothetical protein